MTYDYDLIVIGGGAAGLTASGMSAVLGAKTALIEARKLGGDCTWHGCIPSKSLLKAAKVAHAIRSAEIFGLASSDPGHDFARVMERVSSIRQYIYEEADAPPNMERLGVEVLSGCARFLNRHAVEFSGNGGSRTLTSRYFVIASGSLPRMPQFPGADRAGILNNETLFDLEHLPQRLLILGAGPVAIEMAQAFHRLGSAVTVVNRSNRILSRDDSELARLLAAHLQDEGITLLLGEDVDRVEPGLAHLKGGGRIEFDGILSAIGRLPNISGLNLGAAGVDATEKGITVDRHCRTAAYNIFACGDVTGKYLFTHMAEHTAKVAVTNAILRWPASTEDGRVPWCTFTEPELAHVGRGEEDLRMNRIEHRVHRFPFSRLDRAITESKTTGLVKVFATRRGKILGASILGENAGEMIAQFALAMHANINLRTISSAIYPYPTFALANRRAADTFLLNRLTPKLVTWVKRIFRLRGDTRGIVNLKERSL